MTVDAIDLLPVDRWGRSGAGRRSMPSRLTCDDDSSISCARASSSRVSTYVRVCHLLPEPLCVRVSGSRHRPLHVLIVMRLTTRMFAMAPWLRIVIVMCLTISVQHSRVDLRALPSSTPGSPPQA